MRTPELHYSALIDTRTKILLSVSTHDAVTSFLSECTPGSQYVNAVDFPNYPKGLPFQMTHEREYTNWTWVLDSRLFRETAADSKNNEMRIRSELAVAKSESLRRIIHFLNVLRVRVDTGVDLQESVYLDKKSQAYAFRAKEYSEDSLLEFPYVVQYADFAQISLQQAADDIIFKSRLDDDLLVKTELIRLTYFKYIRDAKTPEESQKIVGKFLYECFRVPLK